MGILDNNLMGILDNKSTHIKKENVTNLNPFLL